MLHELVYFSETSKHLDIVNVTRCDGSRCSDGSVPNAGWCEGEFRVNWYCTDGRHGLLRPREVVS